MEPRHYTGIVLMTISLLFIPVGWLFSSVFFVAGMVLFAIGLFIFMTQKYLDHATKDEFNYGKHSSHLIPGDVHDHSGWSRGGRSCGWESSSQGNDSSCGD